MLGFLKWVGLVLGLFAAGLWLPTWAFVVLVGGGVLYAVSMFVARPRASAIPTAPDVNRLNQPAAESATEKPAASAATGSRWRRARGVVYLVTCLGVAGWFAYWRIPEDRDYILLPAGHGEVTRVAWREWIWASP